MNRVCAGVPWRVRRPNCEGKARTRQRRGSGEKGRVGREQGNEAKVWLNLLSCRGCMGGIMKSKLCINKIIQICRLMQHTFHNMDAIITLGIVDQKDSNVT